MDLLFQEDPELFKEYALRDSVIALIHGLYMEYANFMVVDGAESYGFL